MLRPACVLAAIAASASFAHGQRVWDENQINTTICQWQQLRAAVVRDTVYLDGGYLWWLPGYADGSYGMQDRDLNPGVIYTLNFSTPFNTTQNISAVLGTVPKGLGGDGDTWSNIAPNYFDGALLGNNEEFFLYGGLLDRTGANAEPAADRVLGYARYQYGADRELFQPMFFEVELSENTTRYVAFGGAASAPSENLAWYFSGLRSPTWGNIYTTSRNLSVAAVNVSSSLIKVDMARQRHEVFTNHTLPPEIRGRANPELVWVPVGPRGILVALGGVVDPDFVNVNGTSFNETASTSQSPDFMSTIDIYDVDGDQWFRQKTTGSGPGQLARGCAVVARAQDDSSFNIYYYGGYDGLHSKEPFSDDVWVLSLPSFTWVKLASGTGDGRAGHKCVTPYPDQMLVIGGYPSLQGFTSACLKETIRVFNLSTGEWLDRYDPAIYSNYTVPSAVQESIGGSGTGGATATTPSPSWDASELAGIFATPYPTSKMTTYYPYASVAPTNNTNPDVPPPTVQDDGGGLPSYLPPVLGVVLGLVFLTMVAVLIVLWRRRRLLSQGGGTMSEAGTEDTPGHRITSWLRGQPTEPKAPTVTSSDSYSPLGSTDADSVGMPPRSANIAEMMNTEVRMPAELPDTSPRAELQDNALSTVSGTTASLNNLARYPNTHQTDYAHPAPQPSPPPIPQDESPVFYRPDSDALGRAPTATTSPTGTTASPTGTGASPTATSPADAVAAAASGRTSKVLSGVSNLSERDRAHLRQISDTTVSSVTTAPPVAGTSYSQQQQHQHQHQPLQQQNDGGDGGMTGVVESPAAVSPPTATTSAGPGGGDYLGARPLPGQGQTSPLRRSVFSEDISGGEEESDGGRRRR